VPALPLDEAGKYVAGAYVSFAVLLLIYVAIMAARLSRLQREIAELADRAEGRGENGVGESASLEGERQSVGERIAP
jgi:hypothetical protein